MYRVDKNLNPKPQIADLTAALGRFQELGNLETARQLSYLATRYLMYNEMINFDEAMQRVINVWVLGEQKYARFNWMKGMAWSEVVNSAQRHIIAMYNGHSFDAESKEHHAAHLICNAMMLVHYVVHYPDGNDLPIKWFE
jgi:hypothetical protein